MGVLSTNYAKIVPGALISASYVSDVYDVLMGSEAESIIISGSLTISGSSIATKGYTGSLHGTASYATTASYVLYYNSSSLSDFATSASYAVSASRATSASFASTAATANVASNVSVQNIIGTGTYFLTMVDSQNVDSASAELVSTQDLSYNGFTGVLSFFNGVGTVQATATSASRAVTASYALTASYVATATNAVSASTAVSASYALTASYVATASYSNMALSASYAPSSAPDWNTIYTAATGRVRYVSPSGSDSNNGLSSIKPLNTLNAAKVSSSAGDIVYVMAGLYEFDNRASAYLWNGRTSEVNLWKNGVTYYFEPGAKIIFHNGGGSNETLTLFNPSTSTGEICTVLGELEFQGIGYGGDTGGKSQFFAASSDNGYTFFAKVNKLTCNQSDMIVIDKSNVAGTVGKFTIIANEETWEYTGGETGTGALYYIIGRGSDAVVQFESHVKTRTYRWKYDQGSALGGYAWYIRDTFSAITNISMYGDTLINYQKPLSRLYATNVKNINFNINRIYFDRSYASGISSIMTDTWLSCSYVLNINSNLIDLAENSYSDNIFEISGPGGTINFNGNIFTKSTGGGRCIVNFNNWYGSKGGASSNQFNMAGNIYLLGSADNASELFYNVGGVNTVNFTGRIYGKFNYLANINSGGTMNINNSNIESTSTYGLMCLHNANTTTSTMRILNSNIKMSSTPYMSDTNYYNILIHNSSIINTGTGHTLYNSVSTGSVQLLNSSVYAHSSSLAINYTSSISSSIIAGNTIINTTYSGSLTGSLTTLPQMIL